MHASPGKIVTYTKILLEWDYYENNLSEAFSANCSARYLVHTVLFCYGG